jgi:5-oxoprolinase (ATP-hydrolysing)
MRSAAIVVLHAYAGAELERELGELARAAGFEHVALSHEVACELGMLARGDTTMLDAYLTPLIGDYVRGLLGELAGSHVRLMQSSGALVDASRFRGQNAILSGPAAGVVAAARVASHAGSARAIGFDMGGTSTDVSRWDAELERVYETMVGGVRVRAPMLAIHTVAAGGGSLCRFDGRRLSVGPESAGADPGPLCYGNPGASGLTVTDCNLMLGRLQPDRFPFALDAERPRAALERLSRELSVRGHAYAPNEVAEGFLRVANGNMAEAIRRVSVARGYDVRDYALVVFGGAGGQHACALARLLGIRTLLLHPQAGVLSALGMGVADVGWHGAADAGRRLLDAVALEGLKPLVARLCEAGREALASEGFDSERVELRARVDLRYRGTETHLTLPLSRDAGGTPSELASAEELRRAFEAAHARHFGYARPAHELEIVEINEHALARARIFAGGRGRRHADRPRPRRRVPCHPPDGDGVRRPLAARCGRS